MTGFTYSNDFPTLHGYQNDRTGADVFVTKLTDTPLISGRVTSDGTTGVSGVTMTLSGSRNGTVVTGSSGNYVFGGLAVGGDYTVTPSRSGLTFIPSEQNFTNLQTNQTNVNFATQPATISGRVTLNTATGAGLAGVTITLRGRAGFAPRTVNTASDGTYSLTDVPVPGNYTIKPAKSGFTFSPATRSITNLSSNIPAGASTNFTGTQ